MKKTMILLCMVVLLVGTVNAVLPTGGTITTDGDYRIHTFTVNGTFNNTDTGITNISILVVAGGGGGGIYGGGGGAGGLVYNGNFIKFDNV